MLSEWRGQSATEPHYAPVADGYFDPRHELAKVQWPTSWDNMQSLYALADEAAGDDDGAGYWPEKGALAHHFVADDGTPGAASRAGVHQALADLGELRGQGAWSEDTLDQAEAHLRTHLADAGSEVDLTPDPAYENATNFAGSDPAITSSSGRRPEFGSSPAERAAYLGRLHDQGTSLETIRSLDGGGSDWISRICDAERLVEQCDRDLDNARDALQYARHQITSEHLAERALTPDERHEYTEFLGAESRWEAALAAAERARARYERLVEQQPPGIADISPGPPRSSVFWPRDPFNG